MSYFGGIRPALLALRAGTVTFAQLVRRQDVDDLLRRRARMYTRRWGGGQDGVVRPAAVGDDERRDRPRTSRWGQDLHDEEDILQELRLSLWRAVDTWDPDRGVEIDVYADVQTQHAAREVMRKAAGYPDKRRGAPARRAIVTDIEQHLDHASADQDAAVAARATARRLISKMGEGRTQTVAILLFVEGLDLEQAARAIYANPRLKVRYRLESEREATSVVSRAVQEIRGMAEELTSDA